jgi:hypothetical protein
MQRVLNAAGWKMLRVRWRSLAGRLARSTTRWLTAHHARRQRTRRRAPARPPSRPPEGPDEARTPSSPAPARQGPRPGPARPAKPEPDETLVVDARAGLRPAQWVERKLSAALRKSPPVSHMVATDGWRRHCRPPGGA